MSKVWFITGASRGFGREWSEAALERGDSVAATARRVETLDDLAAQYPETFLPLQLDVDDRDADLAAVNAAHERFGRLDIVINNAGYGHFGTIEELSEKDVRQQLETNVFGALWITQAALPILRAQGSGHIINVSSIGGITAFPGIGAYHMSKWALEAMGQSLSQEVAKWGIHVTAIEPGGFATDWAGPSAKHSDHMDEYSFIREGRANQAAGAKRGDPKASSAAVLRVVDAENPPLRVFFGTSPLGIATKDYESRLALWNEWQDVAELAQGE